MQRQFIRLTTLCGALLLCANAAQAEVYRWVDKEGKVHYSDNPPDDVKAVKPSLHDNSVSADGDNFEMKRAAQTSPVALYVAVDCSEACKQAKAFLKKRKIPYAERVLKTDADFAALKGFTGNKEARSPTLLVGRRPIEGFEESEWNAALDLVGYPKAL